MPQSFLTVHNQALFQSLWLILDTSLCIAMVVVSFLCPLNNFPLCSIFRNPIVGAKNGGQKASPLGLSTLHILIGTKNLNLGCHFLKQSWDPLTHPHFPQKLHPTYPFWIRVVPTLIGVAIFFNQWVAPKKRGTVKPVSLI